MDYACSRRLFYLSTSSTFTPNFQSIPRGLRMFYAYVSRVDFHSLLLRLISASIPCGLRVFSTCRLPLLLRLISTSIPHGLRVFYASFPRVKFHQLLLRLLSAWITRLFHVSTSTTFTPNFHIYSAWITRVLRVFSTCRLPSSSFTPTFRVDYASFPRVDFRYFYA